MLSGAGLTTAATALTSILYSGQWTMKSGQQYLRARIYDPSSGTFNRLDPFVGNLADPQSLHKYLYAHGNPVMGVDPSGELFSSVVRIGTYIRNNVIRVGRFFYDSRNFATISRNYWAGSAGNRSLHHWLIPQRFTRVPVGFRNAGFNLVALPGLRGVFHRSLTLNTWMGFALRWGGTHATRASVVEWGIRFAIPVSIGGGVYLGTVIDDLIPN